MEAGAFFVLVVLLVMLAIVGGGVYALISHFRRKKLNPKEDKLERRLAGGEEQARPEHVRDEKPQRARFVGTR
jgi:hypothetical protein